MNFSFNPRILLMDNDPDSRDLQCYMLKHSNKNYQITTAANDGAALQIIKEQIKIENRPFDLYLFDYPYSDTSVIEICRLIRETDLQTPIVFFTVISQPIYREKALKAGATEYLIKPNDLHRLTDTVKKLLEECSVDNEI